MKPDFEKWWTHNGNGPYRGTDLEYHEGCINQFAEEYAKQESEKAFNHGREGKYSCTQIYPSRVKIKWKFKTFEDYQKFKDDEKQG